MKKNPQNVFIGSILNKDECKELINLVNEIKDVFVLSYDDIPGIDPQMV